MKSFLQTGTPLVYLPLHRSHLDYLLITWTSWHFGLRLPHIASGDNLNLSGLGLGSILTVLFLIAYRGCLDGFFVPLALFSFVVVLTSVMKVERMLFIGLY